MFKVALLCLCFVFAGCSDEGSNSSSSHSVPELSLFKLTDSFGVFRKQTPAVTVDNGILRLDPYIDGGAFSIEWSSRNSDSYMVEILVSREGYDSGVLVVHSELCSRGLCDGVQIERCHYTATLLMYCGGGSLDDPTFSPADLSTMLTMLPESVDISVRVCNTSRTVCDGDTIPITLE